MAAVVTAVWYTSDLHFGHAAVARLRGFTTAAGHDAAVVAGWNRVVGPGDVVWVLGDVTLGRLEVVRHRLVQLNGSRHLVTGNHDAPWPGHRDAHKHQAEWLEVFRSVQAFARHRIAGQNVLLSHFPYAGDHGVPDRCTQYRLRDEGLWLLHGHVHSEQRATGRRGRQLHVGLDAWGLAPVAQDTIGQIITGGAG